jgi:transcriptional regulator with XRE-family HTH domain
MARKFSTLREAMGTERQRDNAERAVALLAAMDLAELRSTLAVTQEELADRLSIAQSNVSRLERRDDMLISTLRQVVQALGGELKITAVFPEGSVEITQFLEEPTRPAVGILTRG